MKENKNHEMKIFADSGIENLQSSDQEAKALSISSPDLLSEEYFYVI